jgi:hypothetical protein
VLIWNVLDTFLQPPCEFVGVLAGHGDGDVVALQSIHKGTQLILLHKDTNPDNAFKTGATLHL